MTGETTAPNCEIANNQNLGDCRSTRNLLSFHQLQKKLNKSECTLTVKETKLSDWLWNDWSEKRSKNIRSSTAITQNFGVVQHHTWLGEIIENKYQQHVFKCNLLASTKRTWSCWLSPPWLSLSECFGTSCKQTRPFPHAVGLELCWQ